MKKIDDLIMKVKKFFHKDPESLRLQRQRELQEIRELVAEYRKKLELDDPNEAVQQPDGKE